MAFATVTSKGQTTIPKNVRAAANLKPGDRIHFTVLEDGTIIVRVKNGSIRDISFRPPGAKRVSIRFGRSLTLRGSLRCGALPLKRALLRVVRASAY